MTKKDAHKKPKLVRDSFTFPAEEHALLKLIKARAGKAGKEVKKTEVLRAGIQAINAMSTPELLIALGRVSNIKTGRPAKAPAKAPARVN